LNDFFEGIVKINITLKELTDTIILHADSSLNIRETVKILDSSNNLIANASSITKVENQFVQIKLPQAISKGDYILYIDYFAMFGPSTKLYGFYRTQYNEENVVKYVYLCNIKKSTVF